VLDGLLHPHSSMPYVQMGGSKAVNGQTQKLEAQIITFQCSVLYFHAFKNAFSIKQRAENIVRFVICGFT